MPLLDGFKDEDLHSNVVEALKRLEAKRSEWEHAKDNIYSQYLKPLALLDSDAAEQAFAVQMLFD